MTKLLLIARLILDISDKNFKYIRYYDYYNESTKVTTTKMKEVFIKYNEKSIELKRAINKSTLLFLSFLSKRSLRT